MDEWGRSFVGFSVSNGHIANGKEHKARIKFDDGETFEEEYIRSWNWSHIAEFNVQQFEW